MTDPVSQRGRRRVGVFGWGIVAPRCRNVEAFARNLESEESWLAPFDGFGPSNFMVGMPEFRFEDYKPWIDARFHPNRFSQLEKKMGLNTLYAIGAFIQSLEKNPGIEEELQKLGLQAHVYVGTGLGDLPTIYDVSVHLHRAQRRWDSFWARPEHNSALKAYCALSEEEKRALPDIPPHPDEVEEEEREEAAAAWRQYWAGQSPELLRYLEELREIEALSVEGDVEKGKMALLREKKARATRLQKEWGAPDPPWAQVSANLLWNIHNIAAAQISMLGRITGMSFAPVAACASFGYALKLAFNSIQLGEARAVVVGMTDPPPHPLITGAFYSSRVGTADGGVSKPLSGLRGTHASGGAVVWIVADYEYFRAKGFKPLGLEPLGVGVSADADHIITPSQEGPVASIEEALRQADVTADQLVTWDLHATATPGDYQEVQNLRSVAPETVLVTARKGTFGHGMAAAGGWELMAQYLGYEKGVLFPTPLAEEELNPEIARLHRRFVFNKLCPAPEGIAGKLSMGVGGTNACVISRPWPDADRK